MLLSRSVFEFSVPAETFQKYPHDRILEVGCGMEPCFPYLEDYKAYAVVEPSEDFARRALRFAEGKSNIRVVQAKCGLTRWVSLLYIHDSVSIALISGRNARERTMGR